MTIPVGQSTESFTVAASSFQGFAAGTKVEGGTLTAAVQDDTGYDLGTPSSVDVAIVIGAMVRIEQVSYSVGEADGRPHGQADRAHRRGGAAAGIEHQYPALFPD